MADWKRYTLAELVTIKYGKNQKKVISEKGTIPIYGTGGLIGYATEALYNEPSVLIGRKGTIGRVKYVEHPFWTVDTLFYTIVNTKIVIPKYLYNVMSQIDLNSYNEGTTIPSLRMETLNRLEFYIPTLQIQERILSCINPIDDKIEENEKINNNLEQQARAIFYKWFSCHFEDSTIPTGWILTNLGDIDVLITDYVANGSFKSLAENVQYLSEETNNVLIRLTDYNHNYSSDMIHISDTAYEFLEKSKLFGGELIISNVGANVGTVFRCPRLNKRMSLAPNAVLLRSKLYEHYLYLFFTSAYGQHLIQSIVTGSAQPKFNKTNFRSLKVLIPDKEKLSLFNDIYAPIYEQITHNHMENAQLSNLRDTILPKLMSNELDVSCLNL